MFLLLLFLLVSCSPLKFSQHLKVRISKPPNFRAAQIPVEGILGLAFPAMAANGALHLNLALWGLDSGTWQAGKFPTEPCWIAGG